MIAAEEVHPELNAFNGGEDPQMQNTHVDVDSNSHATGFFTRAGEAVKATARNTKVLVVTGCLLLGVGLGWGARKLYQMANEPEEN